MIERSIQNEYITDYKSIWILTQRKKIDSIDSNPIIVRDFSTPLISMDRWFRQIISEETVVWKNILDHMHFMYSIPKQQNTHSFQVHMEFFPGQITF